MNKKEYKDLLIKYYTENNKFIENGVFVVTSGAITFLLGYSEKINQNCMFFYICCIAMFIVTLSIQLYSAHVSKQGCDKGLDDSQADEAQKEFQKSEKLGNIFFITFIISILLTSTMVIINSIKTQEENSNKFDNNSVIEQSLKIDNLEYSYAKKG